MLSNGWKLRQRPNFGMDFPPATEHHGAHIDVTPMPSWCSGQVHRLGYAWFSMFPRGAALLKRIKVSTLLTIKLPLATLWYRLKTQKNTGSTISWVKHQYIVWNWLYTQNLIILKLVNHVHSSEQWNTKWQPSCWVPRGRVSERPDVYPQSDRVYDYVQYIKMSKLSMKREKGYPLVN